MSEHSAEKDAVIDALTTHRHGEQKDACRWCASFYGDIYDRIKEAEARVTPPGKNGES
jgi:hypothetical protein